MVPGFQFLTRVDEVPFRVIYTKHFVERYELGDPTRNRKPVKQTIDEAMIRAKIEEALSQIAEIAAGDNDAEGVIVSQHLKFVMLFALIEREGGFQINMTTTSPGLNFKARSPSDYVIKVNPTFEVTFTSPLSYALKVSVLADIAANGEDLEDSGTFHLGGDLMDYWVERSGMKFHVVQADWMKPVYEVQVS